MKKEPLIQAFRTVGIPELEKLESLNELPGRAVNLEYTLPSGQTVRLWEDEKIYWCNQIHKENSDRCYGLISDGTFLFVCEYGDSGREAQIVFYQKIT